MPRSRYTLAEKLALITEFQSSSLSITAFSKQHGLDHHTIGQWELRLQRDGINGLMATTKNQHYSKAFKQMIIQAYLNGEGTLQELTNKYQMRSTSQLRNWLIKYNRDQTVTASPSRKQVPKMNRKTTFNERVEIVEWINKGNHSYSEAAEFVGDVHPVVHIDRGSAYTSGTFNNFLAKHEVTRSMSRPGTPYDNAPMEHWWNEFKLRWIDRHAKPVT
ncbi:IS66 family insertion sequence element accessory protein TnpA, partial [Lactiplantibacillus plantarum]